MNHLWKSAVAGAAVITLAGCTGLQLQTAEKVEPVGSAFDNALAKDYLAISRDEYREGGYKGSDHFAVKSMTAAGGTAVAPDEVGSMASVSMSDEWFLASRGQLTAEAANELTAARSRLTAALAAGGGTIIPDEMARAQTCFDAWHQEQQENHQPKDIAQRRDCFMDAMAKVEAALAGGPRGAFLVFFDWNKDNITPEAMEIISNVVQTKNNTGATRVSLVGHTDTSGSAAYNMGLSIRRANNVKAAMTRLGVPGGQISARGVGQTDPLVPTGDNVREPQNRRVEINLAQ